MSTINLTRTKKKEKLNLVVIKGGLSPADDYTTERLRAKGYKIGDILGAVLTKSRSPGYNRLAHQIGTLCRENLEAFEAYTDSHDVLKRLQLESGVCCDETAIKVDGLGMVMHRVPRSLSFDEMDEGEFRECVSGLCKHIERKYWTEMDEAEILHMAELMP